MNRFVAAGAIALSLGLFAGSADAALLFADQFNYANGDLTDRDADLSDSNPGTGDNVSGGVWRPHSGAGNVPEIDVVNGQAQLLIPGSEDANRSIPLAEAMMAGETWYYAAKVTVNDQRATPSTTAIINDYFLHFKDSGVTNLRARLYVNNPSTGTGGAGFRFGMGASSGAANAVNWGTDLAFGTQYTVVGSYEFDTGFAKLWVNPVDQSSTSISATAAPNSGTFVSSLALRQGFLAGASANTQVLVDAVSMADTFGDALAGLVPEPSSAVLGLCSLLGLIAARRRRG
jgi:hypothetical protein